MLWDVILQAEQQVMSDPGTGGTPVLYKEYDVKTRRVIRMLKDTLFLSMFPTGNAVLGSGTDLSVIALVLMRVR